MSLSEPSDLIAFSHLRWGPVADRPQQLLSHLAGPWRVYFVEAPQRTSGKARLEVRWIGPQLSVLVPHTPLASEGFSDEQLAAVQPMLAQWLAREGISEPLAWLTTPMALPWAHAVRPACIVYDCMDDFASRPHCPPLLPQHERALLDEAAIVFAGGPSLFQALRHQHPNVHCVPSSVEAGHFSPGRLQAGTEEERIASALQGALPRPRLGCFDAVDERLDLKLLARLADERPDWQIVMAAGVAPAIAPCLPLRPNLHWLGAQPYERMPYLLAGWDLCLMPYAVGEATRLFSPATTLQYMAGEKPVVSTAVADVIMLHGDAVAVAGSASSFVESCDRLLAESAAQRFLRQREMLNTLSTTSWPRTAASVHHLVSAAHLAAMRGRGLRQPRAAMPLPPAARPLPARLSAAS